MNFKFKESRNQAGLLAWYLADRLVSPTVKIEESLVLNGFWRSGTTWVQQVLSKALDAKPVFEPFSEAVPHSYRYLEKLGALDENIVKSFMPYVSPDGEWPLELESLIKQSLQSTLPPHHFTYAGRNSYRDSFKKRLVLKFVKGAFLLPAIANKFAVPILHIRRDPRMVVASICRQPGWGGRIFEEISIFQQLLKIPDGRQCIFEPFRGEILSTDTGSLVEKIVTYWAVTEWYIQQSKEYAQGKIVVVKYEDLLNASDQEWMSLLNKLNLQAKSQFSDWGVDNPSFTSQKGRELEKRSKDYTDILSVKDVSLIEAVVRSYGLEDSLI